ncbi:MAG: F0F1 ATP synthase subunit alpha, partial [Bacillus sp. (in: firmicutes)]
DIRRFEAEFLSWLDQNRSELLETIRTTGDLPKDDDMVSAIKDFKKTFVASA